MGLSLLHALFTLRNHLGYLRSGIHTFCHVCVEYF